MFSDYGPVHSFEPVLHPILSRNVDMNQLVYPITVHPYGLSDAKSSVKFYGPGKSELGTNYSFSIHPDWTNRHNFINAEVKPLDAVYQGVPSIVKIDAEGHEMSVLKGAEGLIKSCRPSLYIEIFEGQEQLLEYLKGLGYTHVFNRPDNMYLFVNVAG
jgi:FkbM family methyltransferase